MGRGLTEGSLAEVCSLVTDGTHDTPKRVPSGFPLIKAKEIVSGQIDFSRCDQISEAEHRKVIARSKPEFGDTLFTHIGASLGVAAFVNTTREFSIKNIALFKPNPAIIDSRYLYYLVVSPDFQSLAIGTKTGSAQPFLGLSQLRGHRIQYHRSLAVQQRIAGILSAYDELIENSQRRIKILESMARALYREWFVHFRFPGHENHPRVASPLGEIPQGWEVKTLNDVVDDIVDYRGKTPNKLNGDWSNEGILALSALNVKGGRLVSLEKSRCVNEDLYSRWMKNPLQRGDILMTSEAPLGELYFLCREERYCLSQRLFSIRANREVIAPVVLYLCMESEQTQHELRSRASGATVSGIRQSELRKIPIVVPLRTMQERAAPILQQLAEQKFTLDAQLQNLRRTRDLLLPRLLSGQIDVEAI